MEKRIFTEETFGKTDTTELVGEGTVFDRCTFRGSIFTQSQLSGTTLLDCLFTECDFSLASFAGTVTDGATFSGCRMSGASFGERTGGHRRFSASFTACILDNVFDHCALKNASFDRCDLSGATFSGNDLTNTDFLSSYGFTIDPETNRLNGAHFSLASLPGLLAKYRIKVEDVPLSFPPCD